MKITARRLPLCTLAAALLFAAGAAARAEGPYRSRDNPNAAHDLIEGHYPVPYQLPTVKEITATLERIRAYLDGASPLAVIDRKTRRPIADFSTLNPDASVESGKVSLISYPSGVLYAAMLSATDATGDRDFAAFTARRFQFIGDHLAYFTALAARDGVGRNSFKSLLHPGSLDACGAMGAALVKARLAGVGPDLSSVIDRWADYISHKQFRLADGTLARNTPQPGSLWADDFYMSIPFLTQLGKLTGNPAYYDDAVKQVVQLSARLFDWRTGLFAHGWSQGDPDYNTEFYWGRANGWCALAMCELLDGLPANHPGRDAVLKILRTQLRSLATLQSGDGLWHQMLDKPDSYLETSCSAMFTYAFAHAVNRGWISAAIYGPVAQAGWNGLTTKITAGGHVEGTCVGTNYARDMVYYYNRPAMDDLHGYGPVIFAGAEMIRLIQNPRLRIRYTGRTYVYTGK